MSGPPGDRLVARTTVEARSYELDAFGHVNHAVFLNYLEYGRFHLLAEAGFPFPALAARAWGIYVVRVEVDYLREVRLGDRIRVEAWAEGYRRTSMLLGQRIVREDDPAVEVARARVTAVWVGPDRRPMRVPAEVRAALGGEGPAAPLS